MQYQRLWICQEIELMYADDERNHGEVTDVRGDSRPFLSAGCEGLRFEARALEDKQWPHSLYKI